MSTVLENLRRAQEAGQISREDAEGLAEFYKTALKNHNGDEEAAKRSIAAWLAKVSARSRPTQAPISQLTKVGQAVVGLVVGGIAGVFISLTLYLFVSLVFQATGATRLRVPVGGILLAFAAPIAGAILGAMLGWQSDFRDALNHLRRVADRTSLLDRAWIAWGAVWTAVILMAFAVFDPFNRYSFAYWRSHDVVRLALLWLGPIGGGWILARLMGWVAKGRRE